MTFIPKQYAQHNLIICDALLNYLFKMQFIFESEIKTKHNFFVITIFSILKFTSYPQFCIE